MALRQLDAANAELVALRPAAESLRFSVRAYETKYKDMAARVAVSGRVYTIGVVGSSLCQIAQHAREGGKGLDGPLQWR